MPAWLNRLRDRYPVLDHVVRTVRHYGSVNGRLQSGGVTYYAFLSVFPLLALGFFVVGYVAYLYPQADRDLVEAVDDVLPGLLGDGDGELSLDSIRDNAAAAGWIGLAGLLYAGLGWISALREALTKVFEVPAAEAPGFIAGKRRDLVSLVVIGSVLLLSVAVSGIVVRLSKEILEALTLGDELDPLLKVLAVVLGVAASTVLFYAMFRLPARPHEPSRALWSGALLGALAFEALKQLSTFLLGRTQEQPAFQAFGIALILLVWINYFSQVVMLSASWAHTTRREDGASLPPG